MTEEGIQVFQFLIKTKKACNENWIPRNKVPGVLKYYINTTPDWFGSTRELMAPHPELGWPTLINALFTAIFQFGSVKVACLARRYDSMWSLRQDEQETEQAFVQRIIK